MGFVAFFLVLFGIGAALGLLYVLIRAVGMASKGARFAAQDLKRVNAESAEKGRALAAKWEAKKKRARAQP